MFQRARRKLSDMAGGGTVEQTIVIGDTMETDIRGAIESGLMAYLVLSGSTRIENLCEYVYQPTRVLNSVADLVEEIKTGTPSSRLDSPAYTQTAESLSRPGLRHQTDGDHPRRQRPARNAVLQAAA
ncbi:hypothetical protein SDC9_202195 [bioreactor metagenome]|uniref:Uncharacterized protein n=1 Tax=bioreactor metagenome TaxID=1076179 RepID=A0A645IT01_9ZZZZ